MAQMFLPHAEVLSCDYWLPALKMLLFYRVLSLLANRLFVFKGLFFVF